MSERHPWGSEPYSRLLSAADLQEQQGRAVLLEVTTRLLQPTVYVVGVYLLLVGHYRTGGGFAAGLVLALALVLRRLSGGHYEVGVAIPVPPGVLLGSGLTLVAGYGVTGLLAAGEPLSSTKVSLGLGPLGHLEVAASLVFEIGIALIVLGIVVDVLRTLGADEGGGA